MTPRHRTWRRSSLWRRDRGRRRSDRLVAQLLEPRHAPAIFGVPSLVADIRPGAQGSILQTTSSVGPKADAVIVAGDVALFVADDGVHGLELWRTDGTAAGTFLVHDIRKGPSGSFPAALFAVGGVAFFSADDGLHGRELWRTDGTPGGTSLVANIATDSGDPADPDTLSSDPRTLAAVDGQVFFTATRPDAGTELWVSDGTPAGTRMVIDLAPGQASGLSTFHQAAVPFGGGLLFAGDDGLRGRELWRTDGSAAGTVPVADVRVGPGGSNPTELTPVGGFVLFAADDGAAGTELWRTDGIDTFLVNNIALDGSDVPTSSFPTGLTRFGDRVVFAADDGVHGREVWVSDGTAVGTALVKDIDESSSGGVPSGSFPARFTVGPAGDRGVAVVYFTAFTAVTGTELWRTDGSVAGTALVRDVAPGSAGSRPEGLLVAGGTLVFSAERVAGERTLWQSAGDEASTNEFLIGPQSSGAEAEALVAASDRLYFAISDATASGTAATFGREPWQVPYRAGPSDTSPPAVAIAVTPTTLKATTTATVTFEISERGTTFSAGAVTVSGGVLAGFGGDPDGRRFHATFIPDEGFDGLGTIAVAPGAFSDAAGNVNTVGVERTLRIDTVPPGVVAAGPVPSGRYRAGDVITFSVTWSENVVVKGVPFVALTIGTTGRRAYYAGGSGSPTLTFTHVVQPADNDPDGITVATIVDTNGGSIRDDVGNDAGTAIPAVASAGVLVDNRRPTITRFTSTTPDGTYGVGAAIVVEAVASEAVRPGSMFAVLLDTGATVTVAAATAGTVLSGTYVVGAGENSPRLSVRSYTLGSVLDLAGNAMNTVRVPPGSDNLGGSRSLVVDTRPAIPPAVLFAVGSDGRSTDVAREYGYVCDAADRVRIAGVPSRHVGFFPAGMTLSLVPSSGATIVAAGVLSRTHDPSRDELVVTLDRPLPAGDGTLTLGLATTAPGARLVDATTGEVRREIGAEELLAAGYSAAFVTRFQGGLRVAAADFDGDGRRDLVIAPGAAPPRVGPEPGARPPAAVFGAALARVTIFSGLGSGGWDPLSIDVSRYFGAVPRGGLQVAAGDLAVDGSGLGVSELIVASAGRVVVLDLLVARVGARPTIAPRPVRVIDFGHTTTISGIAAGPLLSASGDDLAVATTTGLGRTAGVTEVTVFRGANPADRRRFAVSAMVESGPALVPVDVFAHGATLACGDVDGDGRGDLLIGAGRDGLGNFRVLGGEVIASPLATASPHAFAALVSHELGAGGRFARPRPATAGWTPRGGPDYFSPGDAVGPLGSGFNAALALTVVGTGAGGRARVFAALGATNQTFNTVRALQFDALAGWVSPLQADMLPKVNGTFRFGVGNGLRLG